MGEGKLVIQRSENGLYISVIMSLLSAASWFCDRLFLEHCTWLTGGIACIVFATILAAIASFLQQKKIKRLGATAPVVSYWAPLGLDLVFKSTSALVSHQFFPFVRDLLIRHGRTAELHMMGVRVILTDEAENVRAILMNQFSEYAKGDTFHSIWGNILGNSIFTSDGKEWLANKAILRPHMSRIRADDSSIFENHFSRLAGHFSNGGQPIDVYDIMDRWVLDIVTDIFFGKSIECLSKDEQPFRDAVDDVLRWNTFKTLFGSAGTLLPDRLIGSALKALQEQMDIHVTKALRMDKRSIEFKPEKDRNLMESLALKESSAKGIQDHLIAVILAGKDPIAIISSWALYELAQNPDVVQKLRAEIGSTIGFEEPPTQAQIKNMPYLSNIVKEVMRLYHPLGFNVRAAKQDTTLPVGGGPDGKLPVGVPKGTLILYSVMSLQRRLGTNGLPLDGDSFDPSRWDSWKPDVWDFIPFNHGPRICLGRAFGQFAVEWVIARLFQVFERIEPGDELTQKREQRVKIELNTKPADPVLCRLFRAEVQRVALAGG